MNSLPPSAGRTFLVSLVLTLVTAASSASGYRYEMQSQRPGDETVTDSGTITVAGPALEIAGSGMGGPAGGRVIYRSDRKEFIAIDDNSKTAQIMDLESLGRVGEQIDAAMKQLEAQLAQMPEAQANQMRELMKRQMSAFSGGSDREKPTVTRRGNDRKQGYSCVLYDVEVEGALESRVCAARFGDIPGGEAVRELFMELSGFLQSLIDTFSSRFGGGGGHLLDETNPFMLGSEVEGLPVFIEDYEDGEVERRTVLSSAGAVDVKPEQLDVPAGYDVSKIADQINR